MSAGQFVALGLLLPLAGFAFHRGMGPRRRALVQWVGPGVVAVAFACFVLADLLNGTGAGHHVAYTWSDGTGTGLGAVPHVAVDLYLDPLSVIMTLVITGVGALIHWYSVGYMADEDDAGLARFFGHMNLFIFSMLLLVLSRDFVFLVVGWALVGLSSYLLIGFWNERPSAVAAARKAFVMNVIGDVGIVLASFVAFQAAGSLRFDELFAHPIARGPAELTAFLLLVGAVAKSAQLPLHTWLPDAMEGPTPVSALIHAATMVTAGVYLLARFHPLFAQAPAAAGTAALIGAGTAVMAGLIATVQTDIKRVLAYSTMSQVGYMFFAVAIGAEVAGIFHLVTHAFFKALLFLSAGNVIHALHGEQDIRRMGGLWKALPATSWAFLAGTLALAGIPPLAGFFSKDEILAAGTSMGPLHPLPAILLVATAGITAYYMLRVFFIAFMAPPRAHREKLHEAGPTMARPVAALVVLAAAGGLLQPGPWHSITDYGGRVLAEGGAVDLAAAVLVSLLALLAVVGGVAYAYSRFGSGLGAVGVHDAMGPGWLRQAFYWDRFYSLFVVHPLERLGQMLNDGFEQPIAIGAVDALSAAAGAVGGKVARLQTGYIRSYAAVFAVGGLVLLGLLTVAAR